MPNDTWWIDTRATTYISVTMQRCLKSCQQPTDGERYIYTRNGKKSKVEAFGVFRFCLGINVFLDL